MNNILIIAKMNLFKKENSQNRFNLLNFLNTKENICVIEDNSQNINLLLQKMKFKPNIIMYYCLGIADKWHDIKMKGLETVDIPTYLFYEDYHGTQQILSTYEKYNFKALVVPSNNYTILQNYTPHKIPIKIWGYYINTLDFCIRNKPKQYDILLYGLISPAYPLRYKIYNCLKKIKKQYPRYRIKHIKHHGFNNFSPNLPRGKDLSILLNQSKFAIATSSCYNLFLKKYIEIPLSGCYLVGDIPEGHGDKLKNNIIEIKQNANEKAIITILLAILQGKADHLLNKKKINDYAVNLSKKYCFESGYNKLCEIFNSV
jgi:hypothetical protein